MVKMAKDKIADNDPNEASRNEDHLVIPLRRREMTRIEIDFIDHQEAGDSHQENRDDEGKVKISSRNFPSSLYASQIIDNHPGNRNDEPSGIGDSESREKIESQRGEKKKKSQSDSDEMRIFSLLD